ncbi:DUF2929 family protein [Atopobacter phocae]|uniref:DUF2929 family protein n=1 Tax=Atopobacter phocae TaxID=136492 RepID=UPI00046FE98C|nr:DUF2929 family protein [Atopobacter phocae]
MKYLVVFFWAFILTQMTFFLGASLMGGTYNFIGACITAVIEVVMVVCISFLMDWIKPKTVK